MSMLLLDRPSAKRSHAHVGSAGWPDPAFMPTFEEMERAMVIDNEGIPYACAEHLLMAKKSVNRPVDQLDIEFLTRKIHNEG